MSKKSSKDKGEKTVYASEVIEKTGIRYSTLKHFAQQGLMEGTYRRDEEGSKLRRRYYPKKATERIREIKRLKKEYLPLNVIKSRLKKKR
jgi:DNA-binding transcriptional MerR regulator